VSQKTQDSEMMGLATVRALLRFMLVGMRETFVMRGKVVPLGQCLGAVRVAVFSLMVKRIFSTIRLLLV